MSGGDPGPAAEGATGTSGSDPDACTTGLPGRADPCGTTNGEPTAPRPVVGTPRRHGLPGRIRTIVPRSRSVIKGAATKAILRLPRAVIQPNRGTLERASDSWRRLTPAAKSSKI